MQQGSGHGTDLLEDLESAASLEEKLAAHAAALEQMLARYELILSQMAPSADASDWGKEGLRKVVASAVKEALSTWSHVECDTSALEYLATSATQSIRQTGLATVKNIAKAAKWFFWRKLALMTLLTLVVSVLMGLYLNDELPWESHERALQQRQVGQATLAAWGQLSSTDKMQIAKSMQELV